MIDDKNKPTTTDNDISPEERELLDDSFDMDLEGDDLAFKQAHLDNTDEDGVPLNEGSGEGLDGEDLDVPGAEADDANEAIGEEDEENNAYSSADTE